MRRINLSLLLGNNSPDTSEEEATPTRASTPSSDTSSSRRIPGSSHPPDPSHRSSRNFPAGPGLQPRYGTPSADRTPPPQSIPEPIQVDQPDYGDDLYLDHVPELLVPANPDDSDDEEDMGEIKAALPKEYSGNVEDARRWLLAMEGYF